MSPHVRAVDAVRAGIGSALAIAPRAALRGLGEPPTARSQTVVRILAARLVGQAIAGATMSGDSRRRRLLVRADVAIEALHAVSMIGLAAAMPARRRSALAGGVLAAALAGLEVAGPGGGR